MTKISTIEGVEQSLLKRQYKIGKTKVPANELKDRAKMVSVPSYIPYLSLTTGELRLALLRDQANTFAQIYPDQPQHKQAVEMIDKALSGAIHSGVGFVGQIPDNLQILASQIKQAEKLIQPATRQFIGRKSLLSGVYISDAPIVVLAESDCVAYATKKANEFYNASHHFNYYKSILTPAAQSHRFDGFIQECTDNLYIQNILNNSLIDAAHHVVYYAIPPSFPGVQNQPAVITKRILHNAGCGGFQTVTGIDQATVNQWIETAILRKNAMSGAGPLDSITTGLSLSPGEEQVQAFKDWGVLQKKLKTSGISGANIGQVALILGIITAAIAIAKLILDQLNKPKPGAFAAAQGFGSQAYAASLSDWQKQQAALLIPNSITTAQDYLVPALLIGGAAYLLMNE